MKTQIPKVDFSSELLLPFSTALMLEVAKMIVEICLISIRKHESNRGSKGQSTTVNV